MIRPEISIFVALNDSISSRAVLDYLIGLPLHLSHCRVGLFHFFRKSLSSEELMGKKFTAEQPTRMLSVLEKAKEKLVTHGFGPENVEIELITETYPTVTDGIIDQCNKKHFDMIIIGRKRMSKAEEFVRGDISIKLVRELEGSAILVIKSQ